MGERIVLSEVEQLAANTSHAVAYRNWPTGCQPLTVEAMAKALRQAEEALSMFGGDDVREMPPWRTAAHALADLHDLIDFTPSALPESQQEER